MVKKPRTREDHRGWFSILRRGRKSFIDALQNQEQERNPLETDNEDRCNMIAWEAMQAYIGSDQFNQMYNRDLNTYDKDKLYQSVTRSGSQIPNEMVKILLWFKNQLPKTNFEDDWKMAETQLFGSDHTTNTTKLLVCLTKMDRIWEDLEFQNNYFAELRGWLRQCKMEGPLHSSNVINPRHNKWYTLKKDRETTKPRHDNSTEVGQSKSVRRKRGEPNAKSWIEYNKWLDELIRNKRSDYRNPGSMNK